jgi:hypothetical protein
MNISSSFLVHLRTEYGHHESSGRGASCGRGKGSASNSGRGRRWPATQAELHQRQELRSAVACRTRQDVRIGLYTYIDYIER